MSDEALKVETLNKEIYNINYDELDTRGGAFLIVPFSKGSVFSREDFTEDQKMILAAAEEFAVKRIQPVSKKLNVFKDI